MRIRLTALAILGFVMLFSGAAGESASSVQASRPILPMVVAGVIMVGTFLLIAFEVLHKSVAAMLGAVLSVAAALFLRIYHVPKGERPYEEVHEFLQHDLGVLGVIVGTSVLVEIASHSGLFHFLAVRLLKLSGGHPRRLLPALMTATIAFVTFLTIAPGVLIMTSLVLLITKAFDDDPRPYILGVAIGANSGALVTFASGIPTLMIGTSARIPYMQFLIVSTPLAFLSAFVAYFVIKLIYKDSLSGGMPVSERKARVEAFDEWALVKDRRLFTRTAVILGLTIVGFASAQSLGVGLDFVAIAGGTAALLFSGFDPEEAIKKVNWAVIMFFVGLFVIVGTVRDTGLLDVLAEGILHLSGDSAMKAVLVIVPSAFILSGVVDNIPVAATMIPVVKAMVARGLTAEPLWWGLIAACNLGGNPTPVGSIASVIALHALEKERGIRIGWGEYLKVGGLVTVLQIALVLGYLFLFQALGWFPALPETTGLGIGR